MFDVIRRVTGHSFEPEPVGRREGEPPAIVARTTAIEAMLGWKANQDVVDMVEGAWWAWQRVPGTFFRP